VPISLRLHDFYVFSQAFLLPIEIGKKGYRTLSERYEIEGVENLRVIPG
jgi:hypothetical protein